MNPRLTQLFAVVLALVLSGAASSVHACAACVGDTTGDKMGTSAAAGIFAMVIIVFGMFGAIGGLFWKLAQRAKNPLPDYNELLREDRAP